MQTRYPQNIREEELKLLVAKDLFSQYDTTKILGNIDFCVSVPAENSLFKDELESLVWAEAKQGSSHNILHSLVQLILTIGKARTFDKHFPPLYLAAFDCQKIAFIPYHCIQEVFYLNDFNWNITPADHSTEWFHRMVELTEDSIRRNIIQYYLLQEKELQQFIRKNLVVGDGKTKKHKVNKNNFTFVYQRWCEEVRDSIKVKWDAVKRELNLLDTDFFLADLFSKDGNMLIPLFVLLQNDHYKLDKKIDENGLQFSIDVFFKDNMQAHTAFWNKYERPPKRIYWDYIMSRRDLLVPQDVRERKGSFFTPRQWVELSQQYLADTLGENWQDEYYIWDCCAGTGNLLQGLANPDRIWASTLDKADVDVMHERVNNGANLYDNHIFQFDFLNDSFDRLPAELYRIINDDNLRRHLIIYINPPYAEATTATTVTGTGQNKAKVATENATYRKYKKIMGKASNELFAQFFIRIYKEIPSCTLAEFSKLKILQAANFSDFRSVFQARLLKAFAVPAKTFDNVKGQFPIGFFIWDTEGTQPSSVAESAALGESCVPTSPLRMSKGCATDTYPPLDIYDASGEYLGKKNIFPVTKNQMLNRWVDTFKVNNPQEFIGYLSNYPSDFQNQNHVVILSQPQARLCWQITKNEVAQYAIYFAVRHCIAATWLNDRDQFLYPNDGWQTDREFQLNCLVFTLFHGQNRITIGNAGVLTRTADDMRTGTSALPVNHWLPFTEQELGITEGFASHFMQNYLRDFLEGKVVVTDSHPSQAEQNLFSSLTHASLPHSKLDVLHTPPTPSNLEGECHADSNTLTATEDRLRCCVPTQYSPAAQGVMDAGREVYRYYHEQRKQRGEGELNASLYDIKEFFKGRNEQGKMNNSSQDEHFNTLMQNLQQAMQQLAKQIEQKVYAYVFLK